MLNFSEMCANILKLNAEASGKAHLLLARLPLGERRIVAKEGE